MPGCLGMPLGISVGECLERFSKLRSCEQRASHADYRERLELD
jgi:hypothetical protein